MASKAERMPNVQIAISSTNEFLQDLPTFFTVGTDSKLHHDGRKVNVFSKKDNLFADSYSDVLKVETMEEFKLVKRRLLTLPIYMHVLLERHRRRGNTRVITHGDYVIMINTKHPDICAQIKEKLDEAEIEFQIGKNFALEIKMGPVLRGWFSTQFEGSWGNYYARQSSFCVTNFRRRSQLCSSVVAWVLCFPVCLVAAPLHCAYRALRSHDLSLNIRSAVEVVKGTTPAQRDAVRNLVQAAYMQGLAHSMAGQQQMVPEDMPSPPPGYTPQKNMAGPPPQYETIDQFGNRQEDNDVAMLHNVA